VTVVGQNIDVINEKRRKFCRNNLALSSKIEIKSTHPFEFLLLKQEQGLYLGHRVCAN